MRGHMVYFYIIYEGAHGGRWFSIEVWSWNETENNWTEEKATKKYQKKINKVFDKHKERMHELHDWL